MVLTEGIVGTGNGIAFMLPVNGGITSPVDTTLWGTGMGRGITDPVDTGIVGALGRVGTGNGNGITEPVEGTL